MIPAAFLPNLGAHAAQITVLVAVAGALVALFRLREPLVLLRYWQAVLAAALLLPAVQSWTVGVVTVTRVQAEGRAGASVKIVARPGVADVVAIVLVAGVAFRGLRLLRGLQGLRRCRRSAQPVPDPPAVGDLRDRLGVAAGFSVCPEIRVPATFGLRRPSILLPPGFDALPADQQQAVACHEMLHVRRRDWLFSLVEEGVGTLFWFHPAVAWALGRIRLAREQTVDRGVVALTRAPRPYLEALVELARSASRAPAPAALFLKESHLKKRVDLLLEEVSMSRARLTVTVAASTAALVLTAGLAVWAFPLVAAAEKGREGKTARPPRPVHSVPVAYPEKAKEDRIEGDVVLEITIEKTGEVSNAVVISGPELLAPAALTAVRQWRYEASRVGPMTARVTVRFTLDEKKKEGTPS